MPANQKPESIHSDFLVIGSGIAGLCFAREVADHGTVAVITKKEDFESNTNYAQGGIAVVSSAEDCFDDHVEDTLTAGAGLCHLEVVRGIVEEGPVLVRRLIDWGVEFTRTDSNPEADESLESYDLGREGGHSHRRIIHAKDLTGREVERALLECLRTHPRVRLLEHHVAIDLLLDELSPDRRCVGAIAQDSLTGCPRVFLAPATILSTGGLGQIYQHTTNPSIATGDGIAMAWRAGLPVANLEFVQFHPTSFYSPRKPTFLISEAVRGEGAVLKRQNGEPFMASYDTRADLAPRDIVARAIDTEMKQRGDEYVWLDCREMPAGFFSERFPNIDSLCRQRKVDPTQEPIWVVPAAHYSCGGVVTDTSGATRLPGLYVTGEAAFTGLHGGNRLASNSLLEALVLSHRAAQATLNRSLPPVREPVPLPERYYCGCTGGELEGVRLEHCRQEIQMLMWDYVGIVRSTERLELARDRLRLLSREVKDLFARGPLSCSLIELRNIVLTSQLVVDSALCRRESRGLHYTLDHPQSVETEAHDTVLDPTSA